MNKMNQPYERRMGATLAKLNTIPSDWTWSGSSIELRDSSGKASGKCQLCGHEPIAEAFDLVSKQGDKLLVGSECVENFIHADTESLQVIQTAKTGFRSRHKQVQLLMAQCDVDYPTALRFWLTQEGKWRVRTKRGKNWIEYHKAEFDSGRPYFYSPCHFNAIEATKVKVNK